MAISQARPKRTPTGSRYTDFRKKKQFETGRDPALTKIGPLKKRPIRSMGGAVKYMIMETDIANVMDKKTKKCFKAKILTVKANPANSNYVRRNIITKGCTVGTDKGDVIVTSRPAQDGTVNGYLI
jgi:small subunit ribosomal protein S8e